jgi:hypothetical protein
MTPYPMTLPAQNAYIPKKDERYYVTGQTAGRLNAVAAIRRYELAPNNCSVY